MKLNFKSRKGFTLIELLVVIGILAVLAAIAIPSVAGLIDRANASADKTNSNEMTNAMERFASEYELYCQDIASGTLDVDNLDSAQGRVYNVIGATSRTDIEFLEVNAGTDVGEYQLAIYRDTKYPANAYTAQLIIQNYTKTSSSTFEPKQSDMHYWYSPDCGAIVYAEPNADQDKENKLNSQIQSGQDAKGNDLDENTVWVDLSNSGIKADFSGVSATLANNSWDTIYNVIKTGRVSEVGWKCGDVSPEFEINGQIKTAILIGVNHDGMYTATFMLTSDISNGGMQMNSNNKNIGGWKDSEIRNYLNGIVFNSISPEIKNMIKPVEKKSTIGGFLKYGNNVTTDSLFLLSVKETGLTAKTGTYENYGAQQRDLLEKGETYSYFKENINNVRVFGNDYWLRCTAYGNDLNFFCTIENVYSLLGHTEASRIHDVQPTFVIG